MVSELRSASRAGRRVSTIRAAGQRSRGACPSIRFREITDKRIRRGVFQSVERLIEAIRAYIDEHNENPKPFVWTAKAEDILEKVRRARAVLDKIASE